MLTGRKVLLFYTKSASFTCLEAEMKITPSRPNLDPGIYELVPELLAIIFIVVGFFVYRSEVRTFLKALARKIQSVKSVELGTFRMDLGSVRVPDPESGAPQPDQIKVCNINKNSLNEDRTKVYKQKSGTLIAAKLTHSEQQDQKYDVLMFIVQHRPNNAPTTKTCITHVDYYFGKMWNNVYRTSNWGQRFAIAVSAYGPFLCFARVYFSDGNQVDTWRYIDFDTGP